MKKIIAIILIQFIFSYSFCQNISIQVQSPKNYGTSDSLLFISVKIQSDFEIAYVTATVNGLQDTLLSESDGYFDKTMNISSIPKGDTEQLIITAKDLLNNQQSDTVHFIYAPPPVINIIEPLNNSNIYPSFRLHAVVSGAGNYTLYLNYSMSPNVFKDSFPGSVDTTLTAFQSIGSGSISFTAKDQWGQTTNLGINIFSDSNILLTPIYAGSGAKITDFNYGKVLEQTQNHSTIVDIKSLVVDDIKGSIGFADGDPSYLTPYGACFYQNENNSATDWNNDSLYDLGGYSFIPVLPLATVHTAGNFLTYTLVSNVPPFPMLLYLRNLTTRTNTVVASGDYVADNAVSPDGHVIYTTGTNGNETFNYAHALIDNYDSAYYVYTDLMAPLPVVTLHTPAATIPLDTFAAYTISPDLYSLPALGTNYQINNKFVAYLRPGSSGQYQVWLRDSAGNNKQITFWGSDDCTIELMDSSGDVVYDHDFKRYIVYNGSLQSKDFVAQGGNLYYRNGEWYVVKGRYVYKVLQNAFYTIKDGDWSDPSVWKGNVVPGMNDDVVVQNNITVSSNTVCNTLKVVSTGSMNVLTGVNLTVLH